MTKVFGWTQKIDGFSGQKSHFDPTKSKLGTRQAREFPAAGLIIRLKPVVSS